MAQLQSTRIPFVLRDVPGSVHVDYGVNNDPAAWGYELLTSPYDAEISRGCPVMQATVAHPAQGYAAQLGWIQILDWGVPGQQEKIVDRPPQMADAGIPGLSGAPAQHFSMRHRQHGPTSRFAPTRSWRLHRMP
jgi:hypothetical protein